MRPFRFRAEAALDLRRKAEDEAREANAQAEHAWREAKAQAGALREAARAADAAFEIAGREGANGGLIGWHRSWIVRRRLEAEAQDRQAAISAVALERAAASMHDAHRRRRMLERLRERGWRQYGLNALRHELREMNLLAGLRYLAHAADEEDRHDDDGTVDGGGPSHGDSD